MAGHHHQGGEPPAAARVAVRWVVAVLLGLTALGLVALWPAGGDDGLDGPFDAELADATITDVAVAPCLGSSPDDGIDCRELTIRVTSGRTEGDEGSIQQAIVPGATELDAGDRIVVSRAPDAPEALEYTFVDFQRGRPLIVLAFVFAFAVLLLGRLQGLRALVGAGVSMAVLIVFLLPALLEGSSPMLVALVASSTIAFVALYLTHGIKASTTVALLGTVASLALVTALGAGFIAAADFTGLTAEEAGLLQLTSGDIDFRGLLLAGLVIGALGVLDDVTVTQVSVVTQLRAADPACPSRRLYRDALVVGRDHIASTVNTLVLAYAGASLPLLLFFTESTQPLSRVLTGEVVATEIVRTLVGSIGLVAAVPITTALAVALVGRPSAGLTGPLAEDPVAPVDSQPDRGDEPEPEREEGSEGSAAGWEGFEPEETAF